MQGEKMNIKKVSLLGAWLSAMAFCYSNWAEYEIVRVVAGVLFFSTICVIIIYFADKWLSNFTNKG